MAELSKEIIALSNAPWFPTMMEKLEYVKVIRCKDCKYQEVSTFCGRKLYGCELAEGYSHVCLDDDFCSRAERRTDNG